jgi:hypothetical protein
MALLYNSSLKIISFLKIYARKYSGSSRHMHKSWEDSAESWAGRVESLAESAKSGPIEAKELNTRGYRAEQGADFFGQNTFLHQFLKNEIYTDELE